MPSKFVHLHTHSHYSLLQALPKVDELVSRAKELGMESLALTDYGAMYGTIEFIQECRKAKIKPIIGQCAWMATHKLTDKRARIDDKQHQLVLLAETEEGYRNLLKLTTIANLEGFYYRPRIDKEVLKQHSKGLIGLSGGMKGEICKALAMDEYGKAEQLVREFVDIFGEGNFFIEIQDHPELDEQVARNRDLIKLSEQTGVPLVATKDVHYLNHDDAEAHDVLICDGEGKTIDAEHRTRMTDADYSFVGAEHMEKAFKDHPEAVENTLKIAARCNVELELGKWNFAEIAVPEGETHSSWLTKLAYEGVAAKVSEVTPAIRERMEYELNIINNKGYAPYFLVVSDYMRWAKAQGIITTTRGSAAGSLVSYAIDIVPVNPLTYKLPFERFLNPFRPSPPDIDGDFEDTRRDEVIAYVTEKYGRDKVAQIGTFGTMAARAAVRAVGRVLGLPYALCDRVSKMIPMGSQGFPMTIERAIETTPELRDFIQTDPQVKKLLELSKKVEGCVHHVSVHAAGVVIAPKPLTEYTALQRESGGERLITQYEMNSIEAAGVLKSDFLGIRNLSILGLAVKIIKRTKGIEVDINNLPLDDAKTYKMLAEGETTGLFQLNGAGMTRYLKELKPSSIHDIMAMVALFRPGPMESIPEYIRRKHNPSLVTYLDPRLKDILDQSYGVMTYQDDVLLTAIHIAGYNWEEADKLRKAMGKKIPEEMEKQKEKFLSGCLKGGLSEHKAKQLWHLIEPFAAYGFNKAHAAAYGMVAYQTAYLKANWPAEYMTAVLSAESGDADKIAEVVTDCAKMGMEVLPPDINSSGADFTYMDDSHIRFGLSAIKNLGSDIIASIIPERKERGEFKNITDLASRLATKNFNKKSLEALIKSGALDSLGERNQLLACIDQILTHHKSAMKDLTSGQSDMFGAVPSLSAKREITMRQVPPATKREKLAWERELLGLYVSEHPFKEYAEYFTDLLMPISGLAAKKGTKALTRMGGIVMDVRPIVTKKGDPMAFVRLEDMTGTVEVVVFPSIYGAAKLTLTKDSPVMVEGKIDEKDGEIKVLCEAAERLTSDNLSDIREKLAYANRGPARAAGPAASSLSIGDNPLVCIAVPAKMPPSLADQLKKVFTENPGGRKVVLVIRDNGVTRKIETTFSIAFSGETILAIEQLVGKGAVLA